MTGTMQKLWSAAVTLFILFAFTACAETDSPPAAADAPTYTLVFRVSDKDVAHISGKATQILSENEKSERIEAVGKDGYEFVEWSDGETNPVRQDLSVAEDTLLTAYFRKKKEAVPVLSITTARAISSKENSNGCRLSVSNVEERYELNEVSATIRGRGNSSWGFEKKSYSLKLTESQKLCGLGDGKSKSWVLCANHCDQSFLRNYMGYWLQRQLTNISWGPDCRHVELYLNGEYQGVYLLIEKISANKNKVNISTADDTGELDAPFLLELDNYAGQSGEKGITWFTVSGYPYLIKGEDSISAERNAYIDRMLTEIYNIVVEGDEDAVCAVLDVDAAVDVYLLEEIAKNIDCGWSSFYLYMGNDGKLYLGPAWDFDIAMGNDYRLDNGGFEKIYAGDGSYGFSQQNPWLLELMEQEWFRARVEARLNELIQAGVFERMSAEIDRVWENCADAFERNFEKWQIFGKRIFYEPDAVLALDTAEKHVEYLKNWLISRVEWLSDYFSE